ncbi:MAG TPA: Glu/Leu/Phe/Val dehydrogenase [Acidimicrobiales bacterium]
MTPAPAPGEMGVLCSTVGELGPEVVVLLRDGCSGVAAVVVVDNTACGPAIGGTRMAPDVTVDEVARLARAMTLKSAAARLPHGGAKAGVVADASMPPDEKEAIVRWFAQSIRDLRAYIPGPDIGTDERCMAWIHDEIGRSVGLPVALGGIPLDELGATGYGLAIAAEAADAAGVVELRGARVAVQGFGAVGTHTARFLAERGAKVVAVSDSRGAVHDPAGLPVADLVAGKRSGRPVAELGAGTVLDREALLAVDCDILVPAARPDAVTAANAAQLRAALVLEGANIPVTPDAEARLHERGVLCLPDWIVNAGGLICASAEHRGEGRARAFERIAEIVGDNTRTVIEGAAAGGKPPRVVAEDLALARVRDAMSFRRSWAR